MTKQQNIFFHRTLDFNSTGGGILNDDIEILNLYFHDHGNSNSIWLIGNRLEWKPGIWMKFEQQKLEKLKEINIVSLLGDLTALQSYCKKIFPNVKINYHHHNLSLQIEPLRNTLARRPALPVNKKMRERVCHTSIGTMRLNRYILLKFLLKHNLDVFHPAITHNQSKDFENQISRCLSTNMQQPITLEQKRMFTEELMIQDFNKKQISVLSESYLNFVTTYPNTDMLRHAHDEKYFDTVLCKTVPFMLCEKNSNSTGMKSLGFLPYVGFNLKSDTKDSPVLRWTSLLQDNEHIFKDKQQAENLYDRNRYVIEHNYNRLINTDWEAERLAQFKTLPTFIKEYLNSLK